MTQVLVDSGDPIGHSDGPMVSVQSLSWSIGGAVILDDITLDVLRGEVLAIIGPNGAGKSTLVGMISGSNSPSRGRVLMSGADVTRLPSRKRANRGLGRTFQTSSLFAGLSAIENVRFGVQASARGALSPFRPASTPATNRRAHELLERVRLTHRASVAAGGLSHGDKRKLEMALAMARDPDVLLLDEPMAGVSMEDVPDLVELIRELNTDGVTVCMVEHHMHVVLGLAHRVAVLHHGRLLTVGTPAEVTSDAVVKQAYLGESL